MPGIPHLPQLQLYETERLRGRCAPPQNPLATKIKKGAGGVRGLKGAHSAPLPPSEEVSHLDFQIVYTDLPR